MKKTKKNTKTNTKKNTLKIKRVLSNKSDIEKLTKQYNKSKTKKHAELLKRTKKIFLYVSKTGETIKDEDTLSRIHKLRIPPNYDNVLINTKDSSKLQAIGYDDKNRKQYIYHKDFILENKLKKYDKYIILGNYLHKIKKEYMDIINKIQYKKYSSWNQPESNSAIILYLLNECLFRIGNMKYYREYSSHGITTLQTKHITFNDDKKIVFIKFVGKKGVINESTITNTVFYNIFKTLSKNKKGEFIFDYYDDKLDKDKDKDNHITIVSDDIQKKLHEYNNELTPKMFRTWHTNCYFIHILKNNVDNIKNIMKKNKMTKKFKLQLMKNTCIEISLKLHNTPTVIKNSYLNSALYDLYMNNFEKLIKLLIKCKSFSKEKTLIFIEQSIRK
jgi:DNA topoisomerase I